MPDPRDDRTARALADLVADQAKLSEAEREQLFRRLVAGRRGPVPAVDRSRTSPLGQQGSEFQPLEERDFLRRGLGQVMEPAPTAADHAVPVAHAAVAAPTKVAAITTARVMIFDLDNTITGILGRVAAILERHLNGLGRGTQWDGFLAKFGVRFRVTHTTKEPSAATKAAALPLDYPLYFIDEMQDSFRSTVTRLHRIMDEHLIPTFIPGTKPPDKSREHIRRDWGRGLRGVTVPPGLASVTPYRKCVFFKGTNIAKEANGNALFYVNSILHELGHANNITDPRTAHPADGSVMSSGLSVADMTLEPLSYNSGHLSLILAEVGRLWRVQQSS